MKNITIKVNDQKVQGLIIAQKEWDKLIKITTEKYDDGTNRIRTKKKRHQQEVDDGVSSSQYIWIDEVEAKNQIRDKIRNEEALENRKKLIEKLRLSEWRNKDSTKALIREEQKMQVIKERHLQIEFDKIERKKAEEEKRLLKIEENAEAEKYRKDQWEQKQKQAEIKKANKAIFLKELEIRENLRRNEVLKLKNEDLADIQRIKQEIEDDKKKEQAIFQAKREIMEHYLNENRKLVALNSEAHQLKEKKLNISLEVINKSKKRLQKLTKLQEIKMKEEKQRLSEKIAEGIRKYLRENSENLKMEDHKIDEENKRKYQEEKRKKEELEKKSRKILEDNKKMFEEKDRTEKERSKLSRQWELERWQLENKILCDLKQLERRAKINEMNNYRKTLDDQCVTKQAVILADQQAERKNYDKLVKLWHQDQAEFMTYANHLIEKYTKDGVTVIPLHKAIQDYTANSRL